MSEQESLTTEHVCPILDPPCQACRIEADERQAGVAALRAHVEKLEANLKSRDDEIAEREEVAQERTARIAALEGEVASLREKNSELNRRATKAEGIVLERIEDAKRAGGSLGKTLANVGYRMAIRERDEARAEVERLTRENGDWRQTSDCGAEDGEECRRHAEATRCISCMIDFAQAARDREKTLREALEKYGQHKGGCAALGTAQNPLNAFLIVNPGPCDCGLSAALSPEPKP